MKLLSTVLLPLVLLAGCSNSNQSITHTPDGLPADALVVGESSNGDRVVVEAGTFMFVQLPEPAGGRMVWQIASPMNASVLTPKGQQFVPDEGEDRDGTGTRRMRFQGGTPGEVVLNLALSPVGGGPAGDHFLLTVVVR